MAIRLLALMSVFVASQAPAQSSEKPLSGILDSIETPAAPASDPPPPPAPPPPAPPRPADGIAPIGLPASTIVAPNRQPSDRPFGAPTPGAPPLDGAEPSEHGDASTAAGTKSEEIGTAPASEGEVDVLFSEEARLAAEAEARETARLAEADRRMTARAEASARAFEQQQIAHREEIANAEAAAAQAEADHRAALDAHRAESARQRAIWQARVEACRSGDRSQCAQAGE